MACEVLRGYVVCLPALLCLHLHRLHSTIGHTHHSLSHLLVAHTTYVLDDCAWRFTDVHRNKEMHNFVCMWQSKYACTRKYSANVGATAAVAKRKNALSLRWLRVILQTHYKSNWPTTNMQCQQQHQHAPIESLYMRASLSLSPFSLALFHWNDEKKPATTF